MSEDRPSVFQRMDEVRDRQWSAWNRGERPSVETLVATETYPLNDSELLELIYAEITLRWEHGDHCFIDEYLRRFPQFTDSLRRLFAIHEAMEQVESMPSTDVQTPRASGSEMVPSARGSDRNLLFGILALQMDFIGGESLISALRDWTTQKDKPLGQILVERGDLSAARRALLEPLVDEHVRRHDHDPAASLASLSSTIEDTVDWHHVHDVDVAESLAARRLTHTSDRHRLRSDSSKEMDADSVGRFRILRPHARGGIGEVFLAFDQELNREVALKEIQSRHLRDESCRERFIREAEVTGGLEHPGIVPVYSLGHHGDGRPYYAMRFIRGDSLKDAIERFHAASPAAIQAPAAVDVNQPTVIGAEAHARHEASTVHSVHEYLAPREAFAAVDFRRLLGRFIDVCQAIEYAHSRGVLHRDLKPGNIMLGKYGETLVVDWGLAKVAGKEDRFADVDETTLAPSSASSVEHTADGSVIGTPAYMSPEQAAGRLADIGPAADVYSLGATLYQMLTGRPPFAKLSLPELLARVQRGEYPRPRELNPSIPKPLESICVKAMEVLPSYRYESAAAIAEDLEHWLADEPVNAHREDRLSRASRWVRKHRAWAISGVSALVIVAIVATFFAFWINGQNIVIADKERDARSLAAKNLKLAADAQEQTLVAQKQTEEARSQKARADEEETRAKVSGELTSFMRELFTSSDATGLVGSGLMPVGQSSRDVKAVDLLEHGRKLIEKKFKKQAKSDQLTRAALLAAIGDVSRSLGQLKESKPLLEEALQIRQTFLPTEAKEIAASQFQLATWHSERGNFLDAERLYAQVLATHRRLKTENSLEAADAQVRMAALLVSIGDHRSEEYALQGLATRRRILGDRHRETVIARLVLASSLMDQGKPTEAIMVGLSIFTSVVDALLTIYQTSKEKPLVAVVEYQTGLLLQRMGQHGLAIARFRRAVDLIQQGVGPDHLYVTIPLFDMACSLRANHQIEEAEQAFKDCLRVVRGSVGIEHPRAAKLIESYGELLRESGRVEEALALLDEAIEASDRRFGYAAPHRFELIASGVTLASNAKLHAQLATYGEKAVTLLETQSMAFETEQQCIQLANLGHKLGELPDISLCRKVYERVFTLEQRRARLDEQWTDNLNWGGALADHKLYREAEPYLREAARLARLPEIQQIGDFSPMAYTLNSLGKVEWFNGHFAEAEESFRAALVELKKIWPNPSPRETLGRLIRMLIVTRRFAEAAVLLDQYGNSVDLSEESRGWYFHLKTVLPEVKGSRDTSKRILERLEKSLGKSTNIDAASYRARAVVSAKGDVAHELTRLESLPKNEADSVLIEQAACALSLDKPGLALETLDRVKSPLNVDATSQLRMLFKALAVFRQDHTDARRKELHGALELAEAHFESTKNSTNPDIGGFVISNQLELDP